MHKVVLERLYRYGPGGDEKDHEQVEGFLASEDDNYFYLDDGNFITAYGKRRTGLFGPGVNTGWEKVSET